MSLPNTVVFPERESPPLVLTYRWLSRWNNPVVFPAPKSTVPWIPTAELKSKEPSPAVTPAAVRLLVNSWIHRVRSKFLAVLFPVRMQVSAREWSLLRRYFSLDAERFDLTRPNRRILAFCGSHGVRCFDLLPAFIRDYETHEAPLYRSRGDMHFNDRGQALAGRGLAEQVVRLLDGPG